MENDSIPKRKLANINWGCILFWSVSYCLMRKNQIRGDRTVTCYRQKNLILNLLETWVPHLPACMKTRTKLTIPYRFYNFSTLTELIWFMRFHVIYVENISSLSLWTKWFGFQNYCISVNIHLECRTKKMNLSKFSAWVLGLPKGYVLSCGRLS